MRVEIKDIEFDEGIYPRRQVSQKTVEQYVESLKGKTAFPSIEVQKITYKDTEKLICLDGKHRILAIEEFNKWLSQQKKENNKEVKDLQLIEEIEANQWKDESIDKDENLEELRIRSILLNLKHGDRLKTQDLADVVLKIIKDRPIDQINGVVNELAQKFGLHHSTISKLETSEGKVSDILGKRRHPRDLMVWKLVRLGWNQTKAGELFGLKQQSVGKITTNVNDNISGIHQQFYQKKKSVDEICSFNDLDRLTTWAMILDGKNDLERFEELNVPLKVYDVWNFSECHNLMGQEYPGRIPGQLVANTLHYYTNQGDLVADFMVGSGTTADACLLMNRMCFCSDIDPQRDFIVKHDLNDGMPAMDNMRVKKPKLIFTDPPCWSMKKEDYGKESISTTSLTEYHKFIEKYAKACYDILDKKGIVAFLIQNQTGRDLPERKECIPHSYISSKIFEECGFELRRIINCPQGTQQDQPQEVIKAKEEKRMLGIVRDLLIFEK
jgi:hypothetical protein